MKKITISIVLILISISINAQPSLIVSERISMISEAHEIYKGFKNLKLYVGLDDILHDCPEKFDGMGIKPDSLYRSIWEDFNGDGFSDVLLSGKFDKIIDADSSATYTFISILSNVNGEIKEVTFGDTPYDDIVVSYEGGLETIGYPLFALYTGLNHISWIKWDGKDFIILPHDDQ